MESKRVVLSIGIGLIIVIAGFGGGMIYAANQLEFEFSSIDKISISGTSLVINLTFTVTNPTIFFVTIDGGT